MSRTTWNKEVVREHILDLQQRGERLNSHHAQTHHQRLYRAACVYYGGWPQAIAAADIDYATVRRKTLRKWTKTKITDEIISRSERGLSIAGADVDREDRGLYHAASRHFGKKGWQKARMLAGFLPIDPRPWRKWDKQKVCAEIVRFHEADMPLNFGAVRSVPELKKLESAARELFGSWAKAIRVSGLSYRDVRISSRQQGWWTKPRVLMCIRNLERRGIRLSSRAIRRTHGALFAAAILLFRSWGEAVEAAGIPYRQHCLIWSTKAWLRRMEPEEYQAVLAGARTHAKRRRVK